MSKNVLEFRNVPRNFKKNIRSSQKELKWLHISVALRVLEGNFVIDLGILGYAFHTFSWSKVLVALPFFGAFLFICVVFVLVFALAEAYLVKSATESWSRRRKI